MKIMILGVDGLGQKSLEALKLKKLEALISQCKSHTPEIDNVVSRGWAELYSGQDAYTSGAFYQIPVFKDGKILASQKTGVSCVRDHIGEENFLWNKLNASGQTVGIYTLPSITAVQNNTVFTVGATGGGNFKNSISSSEIYPPKFLEMVNYPDLNLGLRIGYGAFQPKDLNHLEQWIRNHCAQHFYTIEMALEKWPVDCLIFGTRFVTLAYKFAGLLSSEPRNKDEANLKTMLLSVAEDYDDYLARFIRHINPTHLFLVSDHGVGPLEYQVNINELLVELEEISPKKSKFIKTKSFIRAASTDILQGKFPKAPAPIFPAYDLEGATSFSIGYTDVIYINDHRFTGPKLTNEQRYEKSCELAAKLSSYSKEHGLKQFIKFEPLKTDEFTNPIASSAEKIPLPDIRCILAEGCSNLGRTNKKIAEKNNPTFGDEMFQKGFFSEYSGCKYTDVIAGYLGPDADNVNMSTIPDIYKSILNVIE